MNTPLLFAAVSVAPQMWIFYGILALIVFVGFKAIWREPQAASAEKTFTTDNFKQALLWTVVGVFGSHLPQTDAPLDNVMTFLGAPSHAIRQAQINAPDPTMVKKIADGIKYDTAPPLGTVIVIGFNNKQPQFVTASTDILSAGATSAYVYFQRTSDGETSPQIEVTLP